MRNTNENAGDVGGQSTLFETNGMPDTSSTALTVVRMNGPISGRNIRAVTLDTQRKWATVWRQRLREFDTIIWEVNRNQHGANDTTP